MAGRSSRPGEDLDDWFVEAEPARPSRETRAESDELSRTTERESDDWLTGSDVDADRGAGRGLLHTLSEWRVVVGVVALAALLLAVLAVTGVFSAGHHKPTTGTTATTAANATTSTPTTTSPATTPATGTSGPTTTLKPGDHGSEVTALQQALNQLGYSVGTADGVYGPATQAALARFQTTSHLTSDGVFGPATLAALTSALQGP